MIDNKTRLIGLAMECLYKVECKDCPIQKIRDIKDFEKQIEIIDEMTIDEINQLILEHNKRNKQRTIIELK